MGDLIRNLQLALRLVQDQRVPKWVKVGIPLLVAVYFISPVDLIPDFLLGPGQLDDIAVILLGVGLMARLSPKYVVDEHKRAVGITDDSPSPNKQSKQSADTEGTIDGEYRVVPPK